MTLELRCECGQLRGEVDPRRVYTRGTCYCTDCQAFARFLGRAGLVDEKGGTDVLPMAPSGLRITAGKEQLACMSLGPNGLLRWYAACCRTPLANTPRKPGMPYAGLCTVAIGSNAATLADRFGPRDRVVLSTASALGEVRPRHVAFLRGTFDILHGVLRERLSGRAKAPSIFFDDDGAPRMPVETISLERRKSLGVQT